MTIEIDVLRIFSSEVLMNIPFNLVNPHVNYTLLIYLMFSVVLNVEINNKLRLVLLLSDHCGKAMVFNAKFLSATNFSIWWTTTMQTASGLRKINSEYFIKCLGESEGPCVDFPMESFIRDEFTCLVLNI